MGRRNDIERSNMDRENKKGKGGGRYGLDFTLSARDTGRMYRRLVKVENCNNDIECLPGDKELHSPK